MKAIRDLQGANFLTVGGSEVCDIQFYAEGNILEGCHTGKGWFGENYHQTCAELAEMDVVIRRSVEVGMRHGGAFYVSNTATLYLDADDFDLLEHLGELKVAQNSEERFYANIFRVTMTLDGVKDTYRIMTRGYTRRETFGGARTEQKLSKLLSETSDDKESIIRFLAMHPDAVVEALQDSLAVCSK